MIERGIGTARRAHSGANKSKESAGKREVTHRGMGTRGGTGAFRTGVWFPHLAALLAHVSPLFGSNRGEINALALRRRILEY
ncbi:MAG TPA: hypothetical protein VIF14_12045 [Alphaproteobacteria bacterium]|jgi:hypothetical protein